MVAAEKPLEASPEQSSNGTSSPSSGHVALRFLVVNFSAKATKALNKKAWNQKQPVCNG